MVRRAHGGRRSCSSDQCRMRYAKRVFARAVGGVREAMRAGYQVKMVTLTLPARIWVDGENVEPVGPYAYRYMARRFNAFMATARVRWPMLYIRFVELQQRGAPHYHLLVATRSWIDKRELSALAQRVGLGPIVDVSLVRSAARAAHYVTTYVTKEAGADVPRRFRFYVTSRLFGIESRADAVADAAMRSVGWSFAYLPAYGAEVVLCELAAAGFVLEAEDPPPK